MTASETMGVKTITVIGAREAGREMALAAVCAGYQTVLEDVFDTTLSEAIAWVTQSLDEGVRRGRIATNLRAAALANLSTAGTVEGAIRAADLIVETLPDEEEMKIEMYILLDRFAKPGAILASRTQSLSITDLASVTVCPERCIGMLLQNDWKMARLELVRGRETSEETIERCREVGRRMGREVAVLGDREVHDLASAKYAPASSTPVFEAK